MIRSPSGTDHQSNLLLASSSPPVSQNALQTNLYVAGWRAFKLGFNLLQLFTGQEVTYSPLGQLAQNEQLEAARRLLVAAAFAHLSPGAMQRRAGGARKAGGGGGRRRRISISSCSSFTDDCITPPPPPIFCGACLLPASCYVRCDTDVPSCAILSLGFHDAPRRPCEGCRGEAGALCPEVRPAGRLVAAATIYLLHRRRDGGCRHAREAVERAGRRQTAASRLRQRIARDRQKMLLLCTASPRRRASTCLLKKAAPPLRLHAAGGGAETSDHTSVNSHTP